MAMVGDKESNEEYFVSVFLYSFYIANHLNFGRSLTKTQKKAACSFISFK